MVAGPNGAGKSTLLRIAGGWQFPSSGRAEILGERVGATDLRGIRARVGWVSGQLDRVLAPGMPVLDAVLSGLRGHLRHWRDPVTQGDRDHARELLDSLHCAPLAGRVYGTLSEPTTSRTSRDRPPTHCSCARVWSRHRGDRRRADGLGGVGVLRRAGAHPPQGRPVATIATGGVPAR